MEFSFAIELGGLKGSSKDIQGAGETPKEASFELVVNAVPGAPEASAKVIYDKAHITGFLYNNNVLSWTASGA